MKNKGIKNLMRELIDKLNYYTKLYDLGTPMISDKEWDDLYFKLVDMEKETGVIYPDSPTQSISFEIKNSLDKVIHNHSMLSLPKTKDYNEVKNFLNSKAYIAMTKCDGLTCSLRYLNGKLVSAETRGNGIEGEDILHNTKIIPSVPNTIPYENELILDGEIVCLNNDFLEFVDDYKNPRNFAAGSIRLLDANESAKRKLTFIVWDIIKGFEDIDSLSDSLIKAKSLGFTCVPFTHMNNYELDVEILKDNDIPMDGVVFKFDSRSYGNSLGKTEHHFNNAIALKLYDESYLTKLVGIEYEPSRTGVLTPVAIFESIEIDGSIVERASLSNISIMEEKFGLYPYVGQDIYVSKRNMIIPMVEKAENKCDSDEMLQGIIDSVIKIPEICPICGEPVYVFTSESGVDTLICNNENCSCRIINILDHYCGRSGMNIKGLSKSTLEKLLDWNWVNSIKDIYTLQEHRSEWIKKPGFGVASVDKILKSIEESRTCGLDSFLVALGIPLIGTKAAKDISKKFKNWTEFINSINENFNYITLPNFGFEMSKSILKFDYTDANYIAENYLNFKEEKTEKVTEQNLNGITFVITGKVGLVAKNRTELQTVIESLGGKVSGSVSANTNYLINNDANSSSSKNLTAKKLGVEIITEEEFKEKFLK